MEEMQTLKKLLKKVIAPMQFYTKYLGVKRHQVFASYSQEIQNIYILYTLYIYFIVCIYYGLSVKYILLCIDLLMAFIFSCMNIYIHAQTYIYIHICIYEVYFKEFIGNGIKKRLF